MRPGRMGMVIPTHALMWFIHSLIISMLDKRTNGTAVFDKLKESIYIVEQLSNDDVGASVHFGLQMLQVVFVSVTVNVLFRIT